MSQASGDFVVILEIFSSLVALTHHINHKKRFGVLYIFSFTMVTSHLIPSSFLVAPTFTYLFCAFLDIFTWM